MSRFIGDVVADYAEAERQGFEAFRATYEEMNPKIVHPKPVQDQRVDFLSLMNVDLILLVLKSFFTVSLSAFRTAGMFSELVILEGSEAAWAWVIAFLVIGSVEIGIVIYAIYGAYRARIARPDQSHSLAWDRTWIIASMILALLLMIGANAMKSLPVITATDSTEIRSMIEKTMLIAMGIGVPLMAVIDGHFIGNGMGGWLVYNQNISKRHQKALVDWQRMQAAEDQAHYRNMRDTWESSEAYQALARQFKTVQAAARRQAKESPIPQRDSGGPTVIEIAEAWLIKNDPGWETLDDVPSARAIQAELAETHGEGLALSSIHKARKKYMQKDA